MGSVADPMILKSHKKGADEFRWVFKTWPSQTMCTYITCAVLIITYNIGINTEGYSVLDRVKKKNSGNILCFIEAN